MAINKEKSYLSPALCKDFGLQLNEYIVKSIVIVKTKMLKEGVVPMQKKISML